MDGTGSETFAGDAERVGALADPVRLALYRFVCAQAEPVSRDHAAEGVGVPRHQARFHLDRLASDGLLETSHARLTGRSGPGAGRPATLYRRATRQIAISLPDREYELAARLLGDAVAESARTGSPVIDAVNGSFAAYGAAAGRAAVVAAADADAIDTTVRVLAEHGYEPRRLADHVDLHNCPFHALAQVHTDLVCGANRCLVEALADGIAPDRLDARLEPQPDRCCVVLDARPG
ncbi:helix-turn-helix transcriptional regulator [Cellulomonas humilata]|uniref:ArsR family transcriptional regulator n=1 Tax=Cellulomonas humilata TaxID=144055 RepID=A0ABU0EJ44_9CELL|nr:helix-turn-helix domain-containing protein [Cellulomonas humilata]MDQ0374857.1 putative ArsR family transcriptional regulator [Cellulomonas humilata]